MSEHYQQYPTPQPPYNPYQVPAPPPKPRKPRTVLVGVIVGLIAWFGGCTSGFAMGGVDTDSTASSASTSEPTNTPAETDEPAEEPTDEATDEATAEPTEPTEYRAITQRQWRQIAKNPDAHVGETLIVYGQVTQFDSATGVDTFRADVGGIRDACEYDFCTYPTNTILTGDEDRLAKLVEEDQFRAKVTVLGSLDYDTQIGGETTVPSLQVDKVKVLS